MENSWQQSLIQKMAEGKTLTLDQEFKEYDKSKRTIKHWISKSSLDRGGDIVLPNSINEKNYRKNPIVLFNHNVYMPVATNQWLQTENDGKLAQTKFATTVFADDIYTLNVEKVLNGWSIGFIPKKWDYDEEKKIITYTEIELLEYSSVSIPMNQDAVTEGLKMVKSEQVKSLLEETKEHLEIKSIVSDLREEIKSIRNLIDEIKDSGTAFPMKSGEEVEKKVLELTKQINYMIGTSGNEKVFKSILDELRAGDVSHK